MVFFGHSDRPRARNLKTCATKHKFWINLLDIFTSFTSLFNLAIAFSPRLTFYFVSPIWRNSEELSCLQNRTTSTKLLLKKERFIAQISSNFTIQWMDKENNDMEKKITSSPARLTSCETKGKGKNFTYLFNDMIEKLSFTRSPVPCRRG